MNLPIPFVSGNRTCTRVRWRKYFLFKLFRTFTGKMTRGLSLRMVFSLLFQDTLYGDNPLLKPTGIQIATKSYAALQAMASTNIKTVHQTSLLRIESNLDRLGMLSPTHDQRSQQKTGKITLQPLLINKSKFLKATHCTEIRKFEIPRFMVVEALSC